MEATHAPANWLPHVIGPTTAVALLLGVAVWCQWDESVATDLPGAFRSSVLRLTMAAVFPSQPSAPADASGGSAPAATTRDEATEEKIPWQPWSAEAVTAARAAGHPVLVEFTADWSATAQVNEQTSLEIPAVRAKLRELGVVTLRGDNTVEDPSIIAELRKFDRASVPLVVVYGAAPDALPMVLPEVLTPQIVLDALGGIGSPGTALSPSDSRSAEQKDPKNNAPKLILEGKALLQAGKFAEAESRLQEALKLDPSNTAAKHYLDRVQAERNRTKEEQVKIRAAQALAQLPVMTKRQALVRKLDSIILDEVSFDGIALRRAIEWLSWQVNWRDPMGGGINFLILGGSAPGPGPVSVSTGEESSVTNVIVRVHPPLKKVTLRQALDAVVRCAEQPIKYSIDFDKIVVSPGTAHPPLHTRWFKIDPSVFSRRVRDTRAFTFSPAKRGAELEVLPSQPNHDTRVKPGSLADETMAGARQLFSEAGVDFSQPGKQLVYNERLGMLMLRATIEELEIVERMIQMWNTPELPMPTTPPQVSLDVKFCEITEAAGKKLGLEWMLDGVARRQEPPPPQQPAKAGIDASLESIINGSFLSAAPPPNTTDAGVATLVGILKEPQYRVVLRVLEQKGGVDLLSAPGVTTLSGRQAQVKRVEVRYIVTELDRSTNGAEGGSKSGESVVAYPVAQRFELGPVVDVIPYVLADGVTIRMTVIPSIREFIGYDLDALEQARDLDLTRDPKDSEPRRDDPDPLPIFRHRFIVASARVLDGQTLVLLGGSLTYHTAGSGKTAAGDVSLERRPARILGKNAANERKTLLVFVTPTIIDGAGNRVNPPMPVRQNATPPQQPYERTK